MNTRILALPVLALGLVGALWSVSSPRQSVQPGAMTSRMTSRTMPPSDPKPSGPKKPRFHEAGSTRPQGVA
jgi:hypothetical protein